MAPRLKQDVWQAHVSLTGNELSYLQQIQGGQQIDGSMSNGIKISDAKARSSPRFCANIRAMQTSSLRLSAFA